MNGSSEARLGALVDGKPAVSHDELRFVETITALRGERPAASDMLRARVRALRPEPRRSRRSVPWRAVALAAVPAAAALGVSAAVIQGQFGAHAPVARHGGLAAAPAYGRKVPFATGAAARPPRAKTLAPSTSALGAARAARAVVPASPGRLQAYDAYLRLRVHGTGGLSRATRRAMGVARSLGGYVAYVRLDTSEQGDAAVRLRVPIGSVQTAIARVSGLGTIVAQSFTVTDLQRQASELLDAIARAEGRVGRLALTLRDPSLTPERRARLELQLAQAQRELRSLRGRHTATVRRARLATVGVDLTTRSSTAPVAPSRPGRIHRALDDAASALSHELAWLLYLVIVLAPVALVAAACVALARGLRRRADRAVLERA